MTQPIRPTERRRPWSAHAKLFGTGDLNRTTRCSVIVAHPADEVVGAGCLISKLVDVSVLHITDGAPSNMEDAKAAGFSNRSDYAQARKEECIAALSIANVPEERVVDLAVIDQCAAHCLTELTKKIATFLQQTGADIVVTHPYEGAHPDHDATAFATHAALRLMKKNGFRPPVLFEMALHPSTDWKAKVPEFLPGSERETTTLLLDERAQQLKQQMFDCFQSQRASLAVSPLGPEKFRQPPAYDFNAPPQDGKLHYENLNLGLTSEEWHTLAGNALVELFPARQSTATNASSL
ncbi:MAG TPA: PIG-L family deacetylase [Pyrinomonadaceae bacterium]|nr:PIG-L family deacetylase [Pyrinomonadaceae bacterium]